MNGMVQVLTQLDSLSASHSRIGCSTSKGPASQTLLSTPQRCSSCKQLVRIPTTPTPSSSPSTPRPSPDSTTSTTPTSSTTTPFSSPTKLSSHTLKLQPWSGRTVQIPSSFLRISQLQCSSSETSGFLQDKMDKLERNVAY